MKNDDQEEESNSIEDDLKIAVNLTNCRTAASCVCVCVCL